MMQMPAGWGFTELPSSAGLLTGSRCEASRVSSSRTAWRGGAAEEGQGPDSNGNLNICLLRLW